MRVALIVNSSESDPGYIGESLIARGHELVPFVREGHGTWSGLGDTEMVLALGSAWSTYWEEVADPVRAEQTLMASALRSGLPVLGVCFGAQQLATVLGGTVTRAQSPEIGWHRVEKGPDVVVSAPIALTEGRWMQWHYDRFTVPAGALTLATSHTGPQAFIYGRALGLQFHPEVTERIVTEWASGPGETELLNAGIDRAGLLSDTRERTGTSRVDCDALVGWFLDHVAQGHIPSS